MTMMTGPSLRNYNDFAEHRMLEEELEDEGAPQGETWQMVYMGCVLILMFAALLSDKIGVRRSFWIQRSIILFLPCIFSYCLIR